MENGQTDPVAALQAVLSENEALRQENEGLKGLLAKIAEMIAPHLKKAEAPAEPELNPIFGRSVEELAMSTRSYNCLKLKNANIQTVGDLATKSEAEMLRIKHFGRRSLNEIKEILADMGLRLGMTKADMTAWTAEHAATFGK